MPNCPYCKAKTSFFIRVHPACQERLDTGYRLLAHAAMLAVNQSSVPYAAVIALDSLISEYQLPAQPAAEKVIAALDGAVKEQALRIKVSPEQHEIHNFLLNHFGFKSDDLSRLKLGQCGLTYSLLSMTLWQISNGEMPEFDWLDGIRFKLLPAEYPVFSFPGITLFEEQSTSARHYRGLSIPVAGGIRWNTGNIETSRQSAQIPIDQGEFLVASKSIYFGGRHSTFRISYDSVLRLDHYVDAIGVHQNNGRSMIFVAKDRPFELGWFFSGSIEELAERERLRTS